MTHLCIALVSHIYIYVFYEYSHVSRISLDRFASELSASGATFISVLRKKKHENANKLFHDEIVVRRNYVENRINHLCRFTFYYYKPRRQMKPNLSVIESFAYNFRRKSKHANISLRI